jgi:hypothetical protein
MENEQTCNGFHDSRCVRLIQLCDSWSLHTMSAQRDLHCWLYHEIQVKRSPKSCWSWLTWTETEIEAIQSLIGNHSLDPNQQAKRVTVSEELLTVLQWEKPSDFKHIITGNESCFLFYLNEPSELRSAMGLWKESNKNRHWKVPSSRIGLFMEFNVYLMFPRSYRWYIILLWFYFS